MYKAIDNIAMKIIKIILFLMFLPLLICLIPIAFILCAGLTHICTSLRSGK